ncbi:LysR family transcriptional regulator [Aquitalea sp. LB_tupeE]|uniref:LysR family transcriptional regulator n=1 Tax=Aquitalea sp. LB_tupeE TaxID=2748078 RepID=UPI0015BCFB21|nr:LysR family transcriptional regulator [Aquitalea sp. LB_tupeE]NWK80366.1 LysR family transcriptional regulator [Aquitalea sp. LB_tupeE]
MEDRFAGIREFVLAIEKGSLTGAAMQLGLTGSAVGKSISKLEARLGVQLLHRTTRRIDLTNEGEAYLLSCRRILDELDQAESFLATGHREPIGRLRIDLPTTFGRRHIVPPLLELTGKFSRLDLSFTLRDQAIDMLSEGIDMAVRIGILGDHPELIARHLGDQHMVICASPAYLGRKGVPHLYDDLRRHDCLVGWRRTTKPTWLFKDSTGTISSQEVPVRHELPDGDALLHACLSGCGLAQLPSWLANDGLRSGLLVQVLRNTTGGSMPIHVLWQKTWHLQPKVRVAVDALVNLAKNRPDVFNAKLL